MYRIALYFRGAKISRIAVTELFRGINFEVTAIIKLHPYLARVVHVGLLQWLLLVFKRWFVATTYTSAFGLLLLGKNCHAERNTETLKIPSLWLCFTELLL